MQGLFNPGFSEFKVFRVPRPGTHMLMTHRILALKLAFRGSRCDTTESATPLERQNASLFPASHSALKNLALIPGP